MFQSSNFAWNKNADPRRGLAVVASVCAVTMEVIPVLTNSFQAIYVRNNKSKTKKNMRCFPQCVKTGHTYTSFCGNAAHVRLDSA